MVSAVRRGKTGDTMTHWCRVMTLHWVVGDYFMDIYAGLRMVTENQTCESEAGGGGHGETQHK